MLYRPHICNYLLMILISSCLSLCYWGLMLLSSMKTHVLEFNIMWANSVNLTYVVILDYMSTIFMSVVLLIASSILFYSKDYMKSDPNIGRFIWLVFMFIVSMMALIMSPNLISILLGWDGLGLVSYCLVIYYQNIKSFNAGMITALTNRIGDVLILISIALMSSVGSYNIMALNYSFFESFMLYPASLLCVAACTKSAQIPFSAWLPAAMAAPTPVSALVHSSTLVTAGVYMLIRFNAPLEFFSINKYLMIVSSLTMLMAGLGANLETDLKKVIALSTLSQLGVMMFAISMNMFKLAYFHMLSHALFKALLFMCAGNIIHANSDTQDIRKMGNIVKQMPVTAACLNTANLALCGTPFMSGFYSKDMILETMSMNNISTFTMMLVYLATALTVTYSLRLSYFALISKPALASLSGLNDATKYSSPATIPLTLMSIIGGAAISWLLFPTPTSIILTLQLKTFIFSVLTVGGVLSYSIIMNEHLMKPFSSLNLSIHLLGNMWFLPSISTRIYTYKTMNLGYFITFMIDRGWTEHLTTKWFTKTSINASMMVQKPQYSHIKLYFMTFILWFLLVMMII